MSPDLADPTTLAAPLHRYPTLTHTTIPIRDCTPPPPPAPTKQIPQPHRSTHLWIKVEPCRPAVSSPVGTPHEPHAHEGPGVAQEHLCEI
jgi:hypothetical protein